jgi:hypothetical protein
MQACLHHPRMKTARNGIFVGIRGNLALLVGNLRHPSLHTKKYDEANDIWQERVTRDWRFYFRIVGDVYDLIDIMPHPK